MLTARASSRTVLARPPGCAAWPPAAAAPCQSAPQSPFHARRRRDVMRGGSPHASYCASGGWPG
eukprot:39886-Pyramimonas_sp.AAC.1